MQFQPAKAFGINNPNKVFEQIYENNGVPYYEKPRVGKVTAPLGRVFGKEETRERFRHYVARRHKAVIDNELQVPEGAEIEVSDAEPPEIRAMDETAISTATPLVYDPEIIGILKANAPLVDRTQHEGQDGFEANYNRIDSRDSEIGFTSESDVLDLTDNTASDVSISRAQTDMEIWVDLVEISDFAAAAADFYMDVRDTTLGERVANHAQAKEQALLYADPAEANTDGGLGDSDAYKGIHTIIADNNSSNLIDKSTTDISGTDGLLRDVKDEIRSMLQGDNNVNPMDLEVWTSWSVFDHMENEMGVRTRMGVNEQDADFGLDTIRINGVPVIPSHNVDSYSQSGYAPGDEGDVFIVNVGRSLRFRQLAPLSTVPLGRVGLGEQVAMFEFGAPILRAQGQFSKHLQAYAI